MHDHAARQHLSIPATQRLHTQGSQCDSQQDIFVLLRAVRDPCSSDVQHRQIEK